MKTFLTVRDRLQRILLVFMHHEFSIRDTSGPHVDQSNTHTHCVSVRSCFCKSCRTRSGIVKISKQQGPQRKKQWNWWRRMIWRSFEPFIHFTDLLMWSFTQFWYWKNQKRPQCNVGRIDPKANLNRWETPTGLIALCRVVESFVPQKHQMSDGLTWVIKRRPFTLRLVTLGEMVVPSPMGRPVTR